MIVLSKLFQEIIGAQHPASSFSSFNLDRSIRADHQQSSWAAGVLERFDDQGIGGLVPTGKSEPAPRSGGCPNPSICSHPGPVAHKIYLQVAIAAILDQIGQPPLINASQIRGQYPRSVQDIAGIDEQFHKSESCLSQMG